MPICFYSAIALDFLFIASVVYAIDKLIARNRARDNWTRRLELKIPISDTKRWPGVKSQLETCLSFLTGDDWRIHFSDLQCNLIRPSKRKHRRIIVGHLIKADAVCLFSGGLDSLIGAIDWLEANPNGNLLLVSHYDKHVKVPFSDQTALLRIMKSHYESQFDSLQVWVGQDPGGEETTFRSRSFLYMALGNFAANALGENTPLIVPENGTIAINVPLTPSRRGSCSTRTAHPYFLNLLQRILNEVGITNPIQNPLEFKTKGECVEQCLNPQILRETALESVSCSKRGHKRTWFDKFAKECGRCVPCIYRRAALHKVGLDIENYGRDICNGEVDLDSDEKLAYDFRACVLFIRRRPSLAEISILLLTNGSIPIYDLPKYAHLVNRTMDEIRSLLRDKATVEIKRCALIP